MGLTTNEIIEDVQNVLNDNLELTDYEILVIKRLINRCEDIGIKLHLSDNALLSQFDIIADKTKKVKELTNQLKSSTQRDTIK